MVNQYHINPSSALIDGLSTGHYERRLNTQADCSDSGSVNFYDPRNPVRFPNSSKTTLGELSLTQLRF
ncbi:hypothetical protein BH23CHL5_BH23CHL5_17700 [soil metagenome]